MDILRFYKENKTWYADIPSWTGKKSSLSMIFGADKLLELVANGRNEIYIHFSENEIDGGEVIHFRKKMWINGSTYELREYKGNKHKQKLWLCDVVLHVMSKFPKKIYFTEITDYNM